MNYITTQKIIEELMLRVEWETTETEEVVIYTGMALKDGHLIPWTEDIA